MAPLTEQVRDALARAQAERGALSRRAMRRIINRHARVLTDSRLAPINGRFDLAERAIRRLQRRERLAGEPFTNYAAELDRTMALIVNEQA